MTQLISDVKRRLWHDEKGRVVALDR